jgi:hypothetical protein
MVLGCDCFFSVFFSTQRSFSCCLIDVASCITDVSNFGMYNATLGASLLLLNIDI